MSGPARATAHEHAQSDNEAAVELVRRACSLGFDGAVQGSRESWVATFADLLDPAIEIVPDPDDPSARTICGLGPVRQMLGRSSREWEAFRSEPSELTALGDARVQVCGRVFARGDSGRVELPFTSVWTLRAGRAVRIECYRPAPVATAP